MKIPKSYKDKNKDDNPKRDSNFKTKKKKGRPKKNDKLKDYLKTISNKRTKKSNITEFKTFLNKNFKWDIYVTIRCHESISKYSYRTPVTTYFNRNHEINNLIFIIENDKYDTQNYHCHFLLELKPESKREMRVTALMKDIKNYFGKYYNCHVERPHSKINQSGLNKYTIKYYFKQSDVEWDLLMRSKK